MITGFHFSMQMFFFFFLLYFLFAFILIIDEDKHWNVTSHSFELNQPFTRYRGQDATVTSCWMMQHPKLQTSNIIIFARFYINSTYVKHIIPAQIHTHAYLHELSCCVPCALSIYIQSLHSNKLLRWSYNFRNCLHFNWNTFLDL